MGLGRRVRRFCRARGGRFCGQGFRLLGRHFFESRRRRPSGVRGPADGDSECDGYSPRTAPLTRVGPRRWHQKRHALAAFWYSCHLCWCGRSAAVYKLRYEECRVTSYNIERDDLVFSLNGRTVKARTGHTQFGTPSGAVIDSRPAPKSRPRLAQSQCGRRKGVASCLQSHRDST